MLRIVTTPKGRDKLLSDILIRNYLMGRRINDISISLEDSVDKDGKLVCPTMTIMLIRNNGNEAFAGRCNVDDYAFARIVNTIGNFILPFSNEGI